MTENAGARRCRTCSARLSGGDRFCSSCGAAVTSPEPGQEARKNVVVLFVDLVDSTALGERLDPELLRGVLDRYYRVCSDRIAEHGGLIEKYIGDAIMAVFGVPAAHEDDALRAVRAARSVVESVRGLSARLGPVGVELDVHCGVGSGEVVVFTGPGAQPRIVGDTVNTTARLQGAARPGEILVNAEAAQLVRGRVGLEELDPLFLKGKSEPERAWRVTSAAVTPPVVPAPLIGRADELRHLLDCYGRAVSERRCRRVLVHGEPGMGKTRLVLEFAARPELEEALVLTGSCQTYGRNITFHPLAAIVREALPAARLGQEHRAYRTLQAISGEQPPADRPPVSVEEIRWAALRLFTALAERRPLVVIWEDLHWAERTFLDLIEDLTSDLAELPVLVVCVARDDLLENRPEPAVGQGGRIRVRPLGPVETLRLIGTLAPGTAEVGGQHQDAVTTRIAELSGGNPLFVTVMIDALADGNPTLPPTISALLRARIDALPPAERHALQWSAVCGREFDVDQLLALAARDGTGRDDLTEALAGLARRGLVQPLAAGRLHTQTLIRDTCYAMTAKSLRGRWHALLSDRARSSAEAMYHAERAGLLFQEVSPDEPDLPRLSAQAVRLLVEEGTTALHRRDAKAAEALFTRALGLHAQRGRQYADITVRLSEAVLAQGEGDRALRTLEDGLGAMGAAERITLRLQRDIVKYRLGHLGFEAALDDIARHEADLGRAADDDLNHCLLHQFTGFVRLGADQVGQAESEFRKALARARRLDERWIEHRLAGALCELVQWSPATVADGLDLCDQLLRSFGDDRLLLIPVLAARARLLALAGRVPEAHATLSAARADATALHAAFPEIAINQSEAILLSLVGSNDLASRRFTEAAAMLRHQGHLQPALTLEIYAIRESLRAGRPEAARAAFAGLGVAADDTALTARARTWLHLMRAHLTCLDGRHAEGHAMARHALDAIASDDPCLLGDATFEFAIIARLAGRPAEAGVAAARAEAHYLAKGATLPAETVRRWAATGDGGVR
ncbi:AAA family ATPase [Nonomuraea phyllanthi]|uniref:AAA family ATPase n=1 Tax=Nonomuraea phyllanthi TaxID=2219224 RepID=A0A5C4WIP2_9ACTN|nr:adenylate/guanylate cyclase domain-containing protein [Nonomuraea phyllanthi]KAB8194178.1 AAA family ATPase [Nonomuraea phyllanthi]